VLSHHNPERVEALSRRILELSPTARVVLHHSPGVSAGAQVPWGGKPPERVDMIPTVPVTWGDWSVVEATLALVRHARDELGADWVVTLSGDDRPATDLASWESRLAESDVDGIVSARALRERPSIGRAPRADDLNYARYAYRWKELRAPRNDLSRLALEAARRTSRFFQPLFKIEYAPRLDRWFLGRPRRQRPPWTLYTGPQWMALGSRAADAVLGADPATVAWFEETWIPDQGFIHTVVYNDPGLELRNERITYVVPNEKSSQRPQWMTLRREDLDDILRSAAVFARKFDPEVDSLVADLLDAEIDKSRSSRAT
jgi:hypothetical protein